MPPLHRLPFDVQAHIVSLLDSSDLLALARASHYLSALAARALYSSVHLQHPTPPSLSLERRQFAFLLALSHHPQYALHIRHLAFEFILGSHDDHAGHSNEHVLIPPSLVWNAFHKAKGVVSINIKISTADSNFSPPPFDLFPNLKSSTIQGSFPPLALDRILFTSRRLTSISILPYTHERTSLEQNLAKSGSNSRACPLPISLSPCLFSSSLDTWIYRAIKHGALKKLETISISLGHQVDSHMTLGDLISSAVTPNLRRLSIEMRCEDGADIQMTQLDKLFGSATRDELEDLSLFGMSMTPTMIKWLRRRFPRLEAVNIADPEDKAKPWCMVL